jgi:hypothetical protein
MMPYGLQRAVRIKWLFAPAMEASGILMRKVR